MPTGPLGIGMARMGSGTTWIPDALTLPSYHRSLGNWSLMLHGFVFLSYNKQNGERGDDWFGSQNWGMLMASRPLAGGRFEMRTMLSLDPATVSSRGYPLLLQSGETYRGAPLVDRQHPHDLFKELGVLYEREISPNVGMLLYTAASGEPALGPVAFMHRPSAMDDPVAPLGHHWQDATHISFGVLTAGIFGRQWKLEGSWFNGREPNEQRWDFDKIRLDSYSGRLTVNPDSNWSLTAAYGHLESPETLAPDESVRRFTASVLHGRRIGAQGQLASTLVWGANQHHGESLTHSVLAESEAVLNPRQSLFGRVELVQKTAEELVLENLPEHDRFNVASFSLGYVHEVARVRGATLGLGVRGTVNVVPGDLESAYGSRTPTGFLIFLRVRPRLDLPSRSDGPAHVH
ncbi:MAG: hypothetical protein AB1762_20215 [Gemmatimonadota bacterium]